MANKIVKYTLESDGTSPNYIGDGGYYPKPNGGSPPQDNDFIGATIFHASPTDNDDEVGKGELVSEAAVKSYLDTYTSGWKDRGSPSDDTETDFDQAAAAAMLWGKKIA